MGIPWSGQPVMFGEKVKQDATAHALAEFPKESVGFVIGGEYHPVENIHPTPTLEFQTPLKAWRDEIEAVIHSHTNGFDAPTAADIQGQIDTGKAWGLITLDDAQVKKELFYWGPGVECPLIGRQWRSGPTGTDNSGDCYAIIRDFYRDELKIQIPEFSRDEDSFCRGENLYIEGFEKAGFHTISHLELAPGDVILMRIQAGVTNHGAIYLGNGEILHHLQNRLSRRDVATRYQRYITHFLRHKDR